MSEREGGVQLNRLFVTVARQLQRIRRYLRRKMLGLQECLIGCKDRRISIWASPIRELYPQGSNDRGRYLVLYRKNVAHLPVVSLRPQVYSIRSTDQLPGNAQAIARTAHAALEYMIDSERIRNSTDILFLAPKGKG